MWTMAWGVGGAERRGTRGAWIGSVGILVLIAAGALATTVLTGIPGAPRTSDLAGAVPGRAVVSHTVRSSPTVAPAPPPSTTPTVSDSPSSGYIGTTINFTGTGFANRSSVTVGWSGGTACTATSSAKGAFSCHYAISASVYGGHTFTATDASGNSATVTFTVLPELSVSPTSGPAGTTITFVATGFEFNNCNYDCFVVTWQSGSVTACGATYAPSGSWSCSYTIPAGTPAARYNFTASDTAPHTALTAFTVAYTPILTVSPTSGYVGSTLTFNGSGYAKSSSVTVDWSGGTACTATTSSKGAFGCTYTIPASVDGSHTFAGFDANAGTAVASFNVVPQVTVSPTSGPAGTTITFAATGFEFNNCNYDCFVVTWLAGSVTACGTTYAPSGSWSCSYTIPAGTPAASYNFTASDSAPHTALTAFTVTYTPVLTVYPSTGFVGSTLTFNGSGYEKGSSVTVSWSGGTACSGKTNTRGAFACTYTMAASVIGAHGFVGVDPSSGTATTSFNVVPQVTVSPTSGPAGTTITFAATGFEFNNCNYDCFVVTWLAGSVTACGTTYAPSGSWSCSYTIPAGTPAASYNFTASDAAPHTAIAAFQVTPVFRLSPASGLVGTLVTFNGTGYATSSAVTVSWSAGTACTATTTPGGAFNCTFTIPAGTTAGTHRFKAVDANGNGGTAVFASPQRLSVSVGYGVVATKITFSGKGYAASSTMTVNWSGGIACTSKTSATGSFGCTFKVPATPSGTYLFTGTDGIFDVATTTFAIVPGLSATPGAGIVGGSVTFSGTGFGAAKAVSVNWTGGAGGTACGGTTTRTGSFACTFTIPATPGQLYTFTATDASGRHAATTFSVDPSLTDGPASGPAGTKVYFNGTGFAGASAVTVNWTGGAGGTACSATTNAAGNFSCTFTIPTGTSLGSYVFTATDASSDVATVKFTVT
jgi:hypothetical protein